MVFFFFYKKLHIKDVTKNQKTGGIRIWIGKRQQNSLGNY